MTQSETTLDTGKKIEVAMPLFGGGKAYLETLERVLDFVEVASPEEDKLVQWFKTSFSNVSSDYSISRRVDFLEAIQFIQEEDGIYTLGPAGRRFQDSQDPDVVYNILKSKVTAIEEILELLCRGQVKIDTLESSLDYDYDHVKWKVNWLRSLGLANQVEIESYIATDLGKDMYRAYTDPDVKE